MGSTRHPRQALVLDLAAAWNRLERRLDANLSAARGVSFAEYRLLKALADTPNGRASRVDLAAAVGLTPSGVTRSLRPLEKLKIVRTIRSDRDARLALATLTAAGEDLVTDASAVLEDVMGTVMRRSSVKRPTLADLLEEITRETI